MKRPRLKHSTFNSDAEISDQFRLWIFRMLVVLGGERRFVQSHGFADDHLASMLGLGPSRHSELDVAKLRAKLRRRHAAVEAGKAPADLAPLLRRNVGRLARMVGLDDAGRRILEFMVCLKNSSVLDTAADTLGQLSSLKVATALSWILDIPEGTIREALAPRGALARSGLVQMNRDGAALLGSKFQLLSDRFADLIASAEGEPIAWLEGSVRQGSPSELGLSDYSHVSDSLVLLLAYLRRVQSTQRAGVNILLHGRPGTGKSQLVKRLAVELGCDLFEVASEDTDGDPIDGGGRLRAYRAAQSIFANRGVLLLFDEVEDVFNDAGFLEHRSLGQTRKAWINRTLEENRVPTFWLTNSVACLDPAFIRRFDMAIELPVPPRSRRHAIVERACAGMLEPRAAERLAASSLITPAIVSRAASVVRTLEGQGDEAGAGAALEVLIRGTLKAQGEELPAVDPSQLPESYDPAFINTSLDLAGLAAGLAKSPSGRLCFYGPPGTGKSACARWLARRLDLPVVFRRASDLLSKWVGENEQNIAEAFREAERERAVLLLDEADSFLQDRRGASRSWEVTLVNEMLTQMEAFTGIFIASTNLMDGIDQAALRRFDVKAKFDFLTAPQACALLHRHSEVHGFKRASAGLQTRLRRLANLTPGDFAVVARRQRFGDLGNAEAWVEALEAECAVKGGPRQRIGFT
jgi:AAA+ superfamily predicted ATPase